MRIWLLVAAFCLASCAPKLEVAEEPVVVEPAVEAAAAAPLDAARCPPGEDDGIGGTGCQVD
jgi:hypothetical protein